MRHVRRAGISNGHTHEPEDSGTFGIIKRYSGPLDNWGISGKRGHLEVLGDLRDLGLNHFNEDISMRTQ